MDLADLPVPGKARFTTVVAALLKRTTEQLDHPRPLRGNVCLFSLLLQVTPASDTNHRCNDAPFALATHIKRQHVCSFLLGHAELCVVEQRESMREQYSAKDLAQDV